MDEHHAEEHRAGSGNMSMVGMLAMMMAICLLMPLSLIVMSAIGAPLLLTIAVVVGLLFACVFSHRFMKH